MDKLVDLFSFEGRVNRAWYFWHVVLDDLAILTAVVLLVGLGWGIGTPWIVALPLGGVALAGMWAAIAVTVRRFHDLDRSGWHWFLLWIPLVNIVVGLQLLFQQGTPGPNQFGPDPLDPRRLRP